MSENIKKYEFKKGVSGNPNGRPKGSLNLASILKVILESEHKRKDKNTGEVITKIGSAWVTESLFRKATNGDVAAIREVFDRVDGKVANTVDIGNKNDLPFRFQDKYSKEELDAINKIRYDDIE
jgi:hypothetical protein